MVISYNPPDEISPPPFAPLILLLKKISKGLEDANDVYNCERNCVREWDAEVQKGWKSGQYGQAEVEGLFRVETRNYVLEAQSYSSLV